MISSLIAKASLVLVAACVLTLTLFIPLPGVNSQETIQVNNKTVNVTLLDQSKIDEKYWGEYDYMEKRISIATEKLPVYVFMNTCSHEIKHASDHSQGGEQEHDEIPELLGMVPPWNWDARCIGLLDNRLAL